MPIFPDDLKQQLFRGWLEYDVNVNVSDMVDDIGDQPQIHEWFCRQFPRNYLFYDYTITLGAATKAVF